METEQGLTVEWPAIFDNPDMDYHPEMSEKQRRQRAISDSLAAWKNIHARARMPSSFGRAMLRLTKIAGVSANTPEAFREAADKALTEK